MSATYPLAVRTFTQKRNLLDDVEASHINDMQDEIKSIETVLGVTPQLDTVNKVTYPSVAARLAAMEARKNTPVWDLFNGGAYTFSPGPNSGSPTLRKRNYIPLKVAAGDSHKLFDGTGIKIKTDGWYHIDAGCYFDPNVAKGRRHLQIYRLFPNGGGGSVAEDSFANKDGSYTFSDGWLSTSFSSILRAGERVYANAVLSLPDGDKGTSKITVRYTHLHGFKVRDL